MKLIARHLKEPDLVIVDTASEDFGFSYLVLQMEDGQEIHIDESLHHDPNRLIIRTVQGGLVVRPQVANVIQVHSERFGS